MRRVVGIIALLGALVETPAFAQELIAQYGAVLSQRDHYNSNGRRLLSAAAIIRQDRANYHRFDLRDPGDGWDPVFASMQNRARMEDLLDNGAATQGVINNIVNGTPTVTVRVWGHGTVITSISVEIN